MVTTKYQFMCGVLGTEGADALKKAASRSTALENVLLPRAILAWLDLASRNDTFEGSLPGLHNTYLQFNKSEQGYSGSIGIEGEVFSFNGVSVYHVASSVAVALGLDQEPVDVHLRPEDLARLGKTIDILSKAHVLVDNLRKSQLVNKAEAPGPAAAPTKQGEPTQAIAPNKAPRIPKLGATSKPPKQPTIPGIPPPKLPSVKVTKSESEVSCPDCGRQQFVAGRFTGCFCIMALARSVHTAPLEDGYMLTFKGEWDRDSVGVLLKSMGK